MAEWTVLILSNVLMNNGFEAHGQWIGPMFRGDMVDQSDFESEKASLFDGRRAMARAVIHT